MLFFTVLFNMLSLMLLKGSEGIEKEMVPKKPVRAKAFSNVVLSTPIGSRYGLFPTLRFQWKGSTNIRGKFYIDIYKLEGGINKVIQRLALEDFRDGRKLTAPSTEWKAECETIIYIAMKCGKYVLATIGPYTLLELVPNFTRIGDTSPGQTDAAFHVVSTRRVRSWP